MFLCVKNADVYSPGHLGKRDILICNDRIIAIEPQMKALPQGCRVLDAAGRRVIPGLIDQHVHITGGGGESGFTSRVPELRFSDSVKAGVTTLVGLLGTDSRTRNVQNLLAKTKALNEEGITAYCLTGAYEIPSPTLTGSVGDDIMFLQEVIGVKVAISDHRSSNLTKEEMIKLASEARNRRSFEQKARRGPYAHRRRPSRLKNDHRHCENHRYSDSAFSSHPYAQDTGGRCG